MSQYSPGYPPPQIYAGVPYDPRTPARRAGMMMIILGAIGALFGTCLAMAFVVPIDQFRAQMAGRMPPGLSIEQLVMTMKEASVMLLAGGLIELFLGIATRHGGTASIISSLIFTVIVILFLIVGLPTEIRYMSRQPGAVFWSLVMIVIGCVQLMLLRRAKAATGQVQAMAANYQAQYWQYLQQQQYQQGAMPPGYGQPAGYAPPAPAYGAHAYNAPPPPGAAATGVQSGWQWPGQNAGALPPPPPQGVPPATQVWSPPPQALPPLPPPPSTQGENEPRT